MFGDLDKLDFSQNNPEYLIRRMNEQKVGIPPIFIACGAQDQLCGPDRAFYEFLKSENADVKYVEGPGIHDWDFWNAHIEQAVQWMLS